MAYNILVVDDEQSIADLIELYLQNENYHIFKYYCGKDALESLQKNHYDLAILDVMMPDLDGFSLLKKIRKHCPPFTSDTNFDFNPDIRKVPLCPQKICFPHSSTNHACSSKPGTNSVFPSLSQ